MIIKKTKITLAAIDILIIFFGVYISFLLRNNFNLSAEQISFLYVSLLITATVKILLYVVFNVYKISLQYFSLNDVAKVVLANFTFSILMLVCMIVFNVGETFPTFYKSIVFYEFFISIFLILAFRAMYRIVKEYLTRLQSEKKKILIFGVDNTTDSVIRYLKGGGEYIPVGILSSRKASSLHTINGLKIYDVKSANVEKLKSCEVIVASKENAVSYMDVYQNLKHYGFENIKYFNGINHTNSVTDISLEKLLARDEQLFDDKKVLDFISARTVLITGAGGSIGSDIVRQCVVNKAKRIILIDSAEYNLYAISQEMKDENIVPILISVLDEELNQVFEKYKPEIVIHAAAYKHVPLAEENPYQVFKNNVLGTKNCIDCSVNNGVEKFILISTDKAVRPTNVMGATKRVCELYAQNVDAKDTKILTVRFGNVLGSSGSVIPMFKKQIESGGPVTVTHPDITRYFMLINEACKLVLYAGAIGKQQELMVLNMGEPVKIADFAKMMIDLSSQPQTPIVFTGLRPGEKLYEELLISEEDIKTENELIYISKSTKYNINQLEQEIMSVIENKNVYEGLKKMVKEFTPKEKYE